MLFGSHREQSLFCWIPFTDFLCQSLLILGNSGAYIMSKVYLAVSNAPDTLLGRVENDGRVYLDQMGPDDLVGHVDLNSGDIYAQRFGPDKKIGHVDLSSGKVTTSRFGPDAHIAQVGENGRMYVHRAVATDTYIGNVDPFMSHAHTAAALLLLVLPALDQGIAGESSADEEETNR
jgi:hypothetical protein